VDYDLQMELDRLRHAATSWAYQHIRRNPAVELSQTRLRRRGHVNFDELELFVPATKGDIIIDGGANVGGITSNCVRTGAGAIERIKMAVVETHERFSPELARQTDELRERLKSEGLADRFRLNWD